jgi:hypothetical protein
MKKLIIVSLIIALATAMLGGCSSTKLSDAFNKDTVETTAKKVVDNLNAGSYDSVCTMFRDDLKTQLTADALKSAVDKTYGKAGAFVKYKNVSIIGQKESGTKNDAAVAVVIAKYEKKNVIFTISFDKDMKLIGLYMK